MPYKRTYSKNGFFSKNEFVYDEYYDEYICPEHKILSYSTTNREGYKEYGATRKFAKIVLLWGSVLQVNRNRKY